MQENVIIQLIDKYLDGTATESEVNELDQWYNSFNDRSPLFVCDSEETKNAARIGFDAVKIKLKLEDKTY